MTQGAGRYLPVTFSAPQSPIGIAENVYLDFDRTSPPAWQSPTPTLVAEAVDTAISNCNLRLVYRINRQDVMIEISNLNDQLRWERKYFYKTGLMSRLKRLFEAFDRQRGTNTLHFLRYRPPKYNAASKVSSLQERVEGCSQYQFFGREVFPMDQ
jgi:hypothetical protein